MKQHNHVVHVMTHARYDRVFSFQLIIGSSFFALLQRDTFLLKKYSKHNNFTPTVSFVYSALTVSTCCNSNFWSALTLWSQFVALLEILSALVTSLNIFTLTTILWCGRFYISDRSVVAVTPLYSVLLLTGSSAQAFVLSLVGGSVGFALMSYLPLER